MATVPSFPSFPANDANLARLNQLSAAVAFACRCPVIFHLYKTVNQPVASASQVPVSWDAASADSDNGWDPAKSSRYTARTPGYFCCDWGANVASSGVDGELQIALRVTTGPGNPGGAGTVTYVSARSDDMGTSSQQESLVTSATTPYLYAGDYLEVVVACFSQSTTITAGWQNSGNNDLNGFPDGSPGFTGMLVSLGP